MTDYITNKKEYATLLSARHQSDNKGLTTD